MENIMNVRAFQRPPVNYLGKRGCFIRATFMNMNLSCHSHSNSRRYFKFHFRDVKTKVQSRKVSCPRSFNNSREQPGINSRALFLSYNWVCGSKQQSLNSVPTLGCADTTHLTAQTPNHLAHLTSRSHICFFPCSVRRLENSETVGPVSSSPVLSYMVSTSWACKRE